MLNGTKSWITTTQETTVLNMRNRTYIFYPAPAGGKWHTVDKITGVASCHNAIMDTDHAPIHVSPFQDKIHPMICRRCLGKK